MSEWLQDFLKLYLHDKQEEAYRLKYNNLPNKLYKYQPINEQRLISLSNNQVWFSKPINLNDPFDCKALYYDEQELSTLLKGKISPERLGEIGSENDAVQGSLEVLRNNIKITCLTEEPFNMPMWAHYAENHTGMCVEYDFSTIDYQNDFSKMLFPVGYEKKRYNATDLIKETFSENITNKIKLLFFLMLLKHQSWSYEKEWRIMLFDQSTSGGLVDFPIKPTAVYFGLNCQEDDIQKAKKILPKGIRLFRMNMKNDEFFNFENMQLL